MALCGDADRVALRSCSRSCLWAAGTVGVELAGTIAEMAKMALAHDFRHLGPGAAQSHAVRRRATHPAQLCRGSFGESARAIWNS